MQAFVKSRQDFPDPFVHCGVNNIRRMIVHFLQELFMMLQEIERDPNSDSADDSNNEGERIQFLTPYFETSPHFRQMCASFLRGFSHFSRKCVPSPDRYIRVFTQLLTEVPAQFRWKCCSMHPWMMYQLTTSPNLDQKQSDQMMNMILRRVLNGAARSATDAGAFSHFLDSKFSDTFKIFKMWAPLSIYCLEPSEQSIFFRLMTGLVNFNVRPCKTLQMIMDVLPTLQYGQIEMLIALQILGTILKDSFCQMNLLINIVFSDFEKDIPEAFVRVGGEAAYEKLRRDRANMQDLFGLVDGVYDRMIKKYPHLQNVNFLLIHIMCFHQFEVSYD